MRKAAPKAPAKTAPQASSVGLFDMLNQALSELVHTEHIQPPSFVDLVDQSIVNKKANPSAVDPVIFAFSAAAEPPAGVFHKFVELLRTRYSKHLAQVFASRASDFWRFHRFMAKQVVAEPEHFDFLCALAVAASETDPQRLAMQFSRDVFSVYSGFLSNRQLLPSVVALIFAHTEGDESARDNRISQILDCCADDETQFAVLSHTVMQERIFSARLCELYSGYVAKGLEEPDFQPFAVHILRYLAPISGDLLQEHIERVVALVGDERPTMQTALVQLLVDASQETVLGRLIEKTDRVDVLSLALHLVSELGTISPSLLLALFKKIGGQNIEAVCTERCTVESPVGPLQLGRLTNTWNSAAVNSTVINHVQGVPLQQWDVEFALCKLLLKQPMDSTSAQIWQHLFAQLSPQFGELIRDEDMAEVVFDILEFYLVATLDIELLAKLRSALEPVVTVAKEKCKIACTKFLTRMAELGPRFKQIVQSLILL